MNITLRIPEELGKRAKHLAIDEGTTLSGLVTSMLKERIDEKSGENPDAVRMQAWALMTRGVQGDGQKLDRNALYDRVS
ncbi:MAG: hypothetical protein HRU10_03870 [Opitutales bacterium]|nr:hypothetical protein [Opitutales bacterium]